METNYIKDEKKLLRKKISALKKEFDLGWKTSASDIIMEKIEKLPTFQYSNTILIYYSLPDEVFTEKFLNKWYNKKRILLPVVDGENLLLKVYNPTDISSGYQSIFEPTNTAIIDPSEVELAIIPGVGFDSNCNRMGRGKGFYDRLIPHLNCPLIGIGYSFQIVESIPTEPFDRALNQVVTEISTFIHPKYILFDVDGTLLDTQHVGVYSLQKTLIELKNEKHSYEELYPYFGIPSETAIKMLNFPNTEEAIEQWEKNFIANKNMIVPFEGVSKMLKQLYDADIKMGIVTSRTKAEVEGDEYLMKMMPIFPYTITSSDTSKHKPDPEPALKFLEKAGAKPEECLYVGDTIFDCKCSQGAGIKFALIKWEIKDSPIQMEKSEVIKQADFIVSNATELLSLIGLK